MANKFFTLMIIPERSSNVKKIIIQKSLVKLTIAGGVALTVLLIASVYFSIMYFNKQDMYKQTFAKNQFLDNQLRELQTKVAATDSTVTRIQNFEQKLRLVANLDNQSTKTAAIGALSKDEINMSKRDFDYAGKMGSQSEFNYKTLGLEYKIDNLQIETTLQEQSLHDLYELLKGRQSELDAVPTTWPVKGWITSGFGYRVSPFTGSSQFHPGLDIAARHGTSVEAPAAGRVLALDTSEGFGKTLIIDHGYGFVTMYAHLSEIFVKPGHKVKRGESIAAVGTTGRSTGPHLHYEIRVNGVSVNPRNYILE